MNKCSRNIIIILIFMMNLLLSGCSVRGVFMEENSRYAEREYSVVVQDSDFFTASSSCSKVKEGEAFSTELIFKHGYSFKECNYDDVVSEEIPGGIRLTLANVEHDYRLIIISTDIAEKVSYPDTDVTISYYANNGKWAMDGEVHTETYELTYHFRANTSIGEGLVRDGYTLIGWNTRADGTGAHIGLGSRTEYTQLYAEWVKWTDEEFFTYRRTDEGIAVTGYKGDAKTEPLVIPEKIDGIDVVEIASSFTTNMPCKKLISHTLVLPKSIRIIKSGAFANAAFSELYFFDSLDEVEEGAFGEPIVTYHINAATAPVFQRENDNARFADKVDYLMLQEGKRLVLFGGCSTAYGINSELMMENFPEYSICNMGVIGGVNAVFQMQIIDNFLREGDVFVHLPEEMSPFQLMTFISVDYRVFIMVEGNYDLLSLADFGYSTSFWDGYNSYKKNKNGQPSGNYCDSVLTYNIYGDIIAHGSYDEKNAWDKDSSLSDNSYQFDLDYITDAGIKRLCGFYDGFREKGVDVCIGYAPVNIDGLNNIEAAYEYEKLFCTELSEYGYQPAGSIKNHLFNGRYFFDADYHLNDFGALLNTEALITELESAMSLKK